MNEPQIKSIEIVVKYMGKYGKIFKMYKLKSMIYNVEHLLAKPGLICYWQVMGRSNVDFEEWMRLNFYKSIQILEN